MLDLYHAQIGEGNLIELIRRAAPWIGEIQVADVPGRQEPGTGEINFPVIARELKKISYTGTVGLEAWASVMIQSGVERIAAAFRWPEGPHNLRVPHGSFAAAAKGHDVRTYGRFVSRLPLARLARRLDW
jgi:hypothetical protein